MSADAYGETPMSDNDYREMCEFMSKDRVIELLIKDKYKIKRLETKALEANEARMEAEQALHKQNVNVSALDYWKKRCELTDNLFKADKNDNDSLKKAFDEYSEFRHVNDELHSR